MSEFYQFRRVAITDLAGFTGFVIGFVGSAPFAWKYLSSGFEANEPGTGVLYFVLIILAAGAIAGAVGLGMGVSAGFVWEHYHRWRRPKPRQIEVTVATGPRRAAEEAPEAPPPAVALVDPSGIRYSSAGFTAANFVDLASRVQPQRTHNVLRVSSALQRTINIGAWDGERLIGALMVLTDGYFLAAVSEILVDPDYRERHVERELTQQAFAVVPRGALLLGASFKPTAVPGR